MCRHPVLIPPNRCCLTQASILTQVICLPHTINMLRSGHMSGLGLPPGKEVPVDDKTIAEIESALHLLARRLKQARLHDFVLKQAGLDIDQAGLAILYALHAEQGSLRITDLAERLGIDAPAVTRKAQLLERLGLVSRARGVGRMSRVCQAAAQRRGAGGDQPLPPRPSPMANHAACRLVTRGPTRLRPIDRPVRLRYPPASGRAPRLMAGVPGGGGPPHGSWAHSYLYRIIIS